MLDKLKELHGFFQDVHSTAYPVLQDLKEHTPGIGDMQELADVIYALRECEKYVEDTAKLMREVKKRCEQLTCLLWATTGNAEPIRTEHCTATCRMAYALQVPSKIKNPTLFRDFMGALGVGPTLAMQGVVKPDYNMLKDYVLDLAEKGLPLPPGLQEAKTYPVYSVTITRKKDIERTAKDF